MSVDDCGCSRHAQRLWTDLGDFDYKNKPSAWEEQINNVLGAEFPYFSLIGNHEHDGGKWDEGYQKLIRQRFTRLGIAWDGDLGVQSSFTYKGIFFVLVAPKIRAKNESHHSYLKRQLDADRSIWSIAAWHKNEKLMQVGGKDDKVGWELYEAAREGGAIIATAHEHSYSRTHLLSSMRKQVVVSTAETLTLEKGKSFVFVSGLGGHGERVQRLPSLGIVILALGAVSGFTGVVAVMSLSTAVTPVELIADRRCAASLNVLHGPPVIGKQRER